MIYELSGDQTIKFWKFWKSNEPGYVKVLNDKVLRDEYNLIVFTKRRECPAVPGVLSYVSSIEGDEKDILYLLMKL